jgi:hypothetical protein
MIGRPNNPIVRLSLGRTIRLSLGKVIRLSLGKTIRLSLGRAVRLSLSESEVIRKRIYRGLKYDDFLEVRSNSIYSMLRIYHYYSCDFNTTYSK